MNRAALLKRVAELERSLRPPPSFAATVLRTATDAQLVAVEDEILGGGPSPVWDALVDSFRSEGPRR